MRASSAVSCLIVIPLTFGCSQGGSPTSPTTQVANLHVAGDSGLRTSVAAASVPFKGELEGEASPFPPVFEPPPSTSFSVHVTAEGHATHLGRFTMEFPHRVNMATGIGTGTAVFTAANGDKLLTDVVGQSTPTESPTAFIVVETHTVRKDGTGRFAGASGSFIVTRTVDFTNPFTSGSIEGSISAPGADRE